MGNEVTHVANAYDQAIKVKMSIRKSEVTGVCFGDLGLTVISANSFKPFDVIGTQYITVFLPCGKCIAEAFEIESDHSVIITADGYIRKTQHGKLWVDEQGKRHT